MESNDIKTYFLDPNNELPMVVEPTGDTAVKSNFASALDWVKANKLQIEEQLKKSGGILFRGFPIESPAQFEAFVKSIDSNIMAYEGGTSDREKVEGQVYSSTTMPAYFKMALHHEMAYRRETPSKIFFYCEKAPLLGGQTIIADSRKIFKTIPASIREKFEQMPIRFERRLVNLSGFWKFISRSSKSFRMMSWQKVFKTEEPKQVELILRKQGYRFEWSDRGDLTFWDNLKTVEHHPETGESVWFRPVHFFHFSSRIYGRLFYSLARILFSILKRPLPDLRFSDGEKISEQDMNAVYDALMSNEVYFSWAKGDILCLDNRLVAHGRNRFLGQRKVMVLMTKEPHTPAL